MVKRGMVRWQSLHRGYVLCGSGSGSGSGSGGSSSSSSSSSSR